VSSDFPLLEEKYAASEEINCFKITKILYKPKREHISPREGKQH
jgi:hypothetical protein